MIRARRWAVRLTCVAIIVSLSIWNSDRPLQQFSEFLAYSSDADITVAGRNNTEDDAIIVHNDTRPVAPNGYLCVFGAKGRLNNKIVQNLVGIYMAHHLNRTLLVDDEVSTFYDIDKLSLTTYPDSPYMAATIIGNRTCGHPNTISPYKFNHGVNIVERFDEYHTHTKDLQLASVDNSDIWYWLGRPPENVYETFYQGLVPRQSILDKVDAFLDKHDMQYNTYNSLHLRYFEGKCGNFDTDLCCPKYDYIKEILDERGANTRQPLFIANDRQCAPEVLNTYGIGMEATFGANENTDDAISTIIDSETKQDIKVLNGYDGPCTGTECAVLDFELCVRSNVFIGNLKSSGDWNIREWRVARLDKPVMASVLSRGEEVAKRELDVENYGKFLTRWYVGHWRFVPDCDKIGARQRSKPCV